VKLRLWWLLLVQAIVVFVVAALAWKGFVEQPLHPPSCSAHSTTSDPIPGSAYRSRWRVLRLAIVGVVSQLPSGIFSGWVPVLFPNLQRFGITEAQASQLGFWMTLLGATGGLTSGRLLDTRFFQGGMKTLLLGFLILSAVSFTAFALVVDGRISGGIPLLYLSSIVGGFCIAALCPVGFELAVETGFPEIAEPVAAGFLSFLNTLVQVVFLAWAFAGEGTADWINWLMAVCPLACSFLLLLLKVDYPRLQVDCDCAQRMAIDSCGFL